MSNAQLIIKNLSKTYPNQVKALNRVSFEVKKGSFLVVIGLSGSGKSTLLRCLNRLLDPTDGQIIFNGQDVTKVQGAEVREIRKKVAMIFQNFNLIPRHSVLTNVLMGALSNTSSFFSLLGRFHATDRAEALKNLELLGLSDKADLRADQLSGGQQQRVAIARALMQRPEILLADEPVASLDPATAHTVMDHLRTINQRLGITVICNLHFLRLVREYGQQVIALKEGELVFSGEPNQIDSNWFQQIYGVEARDLGHQ